MADTIGTAYVQIEPSFDGVTPQIDSYFGGEGQKAGNSFGSGFATVLGGSAKLMAGAVAAGTAATTALVKEATDSFGEYEQLVGGVEKLFGNSADIVAQNASKAFSTAGLSANEYMETVTSFSASLINSLGGNTEEAANLADVAMRSMSDNVNTFGSDMESVMNAYQGFAKENYTINLMSAA